MVTIEPVPLTPEELDLATQRYLTRPKTERADEEPTKDLSKGEFERIRNERRALLNSIGQQFVSFVEGPLWQAALKLLKASCHTIWLGQAEDRRYLELRPEGFVISNPAVANGQRICDVGLQNDLDDMSWVFFEEYGPTNPQVVIHDELRSIIRDIRNS